MHATNRLSEEQRFHDHQARARAACLPHPDLLRFSDDDWLAHETWIRPAFASLGPLAGLDVLDFGCGHGMASVVLARQGARVVGFDLSPGYLQEARRRAEANGVAVSFVQADGERLPFASSSFDRVWGNAVLHHLDLSRAARELVRVLKPGGRAVFCEPWGDNPFLSAARRWLSYPGKQRTPDEAPLRRRHLPALAAWFPDLEVQGFQLLGMVRRVLKPGKTVDRLDRIDTWLLRRCPGLWRWCRYVVITLRRPLYNEQML
jgi:2-polyprenyl-3-methyl-5-hydroxy-6-metoxy-1,4-benzoquinol methylase